MSDRKIIYLDDAIDAIKSEQAYYAPEDGPELFFEYNHAMKALEKLPSAQPEVLVCGNGELNAQLGHSEGLYVDGFNDGYRERQSEEQQWIPCSERLPQPNEEAADGFIKAYLVQDGRWMDVARWNGDCWIAWGYGTALTNVIAWMPLPEPYKERREE